jgi:hypothetical protein
MPVLQGWEVEDYVDHYFLYRRMLKDVSITHPFNHPITLDSPLMPRGQWIGIGSTCKRNKHPEVVSRILDALEESSESKYKVHPDGIVKSMKVHLFGYKTTGLKSDRIKDRIHSADSFAYDFTDRLTSKVRSRKDRINSARRFGQKIVHNNVQSTFRL